MRKHIPERDWKLFKALRELAVERSCERALDEVKRLLAEPAPSHYDRYRALFKAVDRQEAEIARAFDDYRRSTAVFQIAAMLSLRLITDDELSGFTADTQEVVKLLVRTGPT